MRYGWGFFSVKRPKQSSVLCLIVRGGSNKMNQGENYQNFLKWGGCLNELDGFIPKFCNLTTSIEYGTKEYD